MPRPLIVLFTALSIFTNSVAFFTGGNDNGSAHNINGTTIVITLFVSDVEYGWNVKAHRDVQRIDTVNEYLAMAGDYLEEQVGSYGGEAVFITDFIANDDLAYYVRVNRNMENDSNYGANEDAVWDSIDEYIDVEALKTKYQADNAVFLAVYAHEILHTFSAPDLYTTDPDFGITSRNLSGLQDKYPNDIMLTCSDLSTGEYVYDRITNEITEVTASYIGLI